MQQRWTQASLLSSFQLSREKYYVKGAPENIIRQCTCYYKDGTAVPLTAKDVERNSDAVMAMSASGLRGTLTYWMDYEWRN